MKLLQRISIIVLITFFNSINLNAQCNGNFDPFYSFDVDITNDYTLVWQYTSGNTYRFPVIQGTTYEWSLSLDEGVDNGDPSSSLTPRCFALQDVEFGNEILNDAATIGSDNRAKITWTATYSGTVYIQTFGLFVDVTIPFSNVAYRAYNCNSISNLILSNDKTFTICDGQPKVLSFQYYIPEAYFTWFVDGVESPLHDSVFYVYERGFIEVQVSIPTTSCPVYATSIEINNENVFISVNDSSTTLCNVVSEPPTPPDTKTLTANTDGFAGDEFASYQWFKDGQAIETTSSIVINQSGLYKVRRISAGLIPCTAEDSIRIEAGTIPSAQTISLLTNDTICNGGQAQFEVSTLVGNNLTYIWQLNGAAIPASNFSNYITNIEGTYSLVLSDTVGCLSASSNTLSVTTIDCTGFETLQATDIVIYPNPANQFLNLTMPTNYQVATISIFDMQGRKINLNTAPSSNGFYQIPLQDIANGLYLISINTSKGLITKRFEKFN
jgi:hypothetical protein